LPALLEVFIRKAALSFFDCSSLLNFSSLLTACSALATNTAADDDVVVRVDPGPLHLEARSYILIKVFG
jgi:hypothetical protein